MEDFVYIILAIIWIVVGIIGKANKKKTTQSQPKSQPREATSTEQETSSQPKTEVETIFEDLFGESKTQPAETAETIQESKSEPAYKSMEDYKFEHEKEKENNIYEQHPEGQEIDENFEFSSQKVETIEEMIKRIENSNNIEVVDDEEDSTRKESGVFTDQYLNEFISDPKKAIIYSEIINKRY